MKYQKLRRFLGIVLLLLACFFSFKLVSYWQELRAADKTFMDISKHYHSLESAYNSSKGKNNIYKGRIPAMKDLLEKNADVFAWIYVEGTNIDYPVMFTPSDPEYYLRRDFEKKHSMSGTPFLDGRTKEDSKNNIIYGHNMKNSKMFSNLTSYKDETYFREHSNIEFITLYEERKYKIIAGFYSDVHVDRNKFAWFNYLDFKDESVFLDFVNNLNKESLFPLQEIPVYGDSFLTLVTCAENDNTQRFVVVGREVK